MEVECKCINLVDENNKTICLDCGIENNNITFELDFNNSKCFNVNKYKSNGKPRGRAKGIKKDPNRKKVRNPIGRLIDFEGPQYNKLIMEGFVLNEENGKLEKI